MSNKQVRISKEHAMLICKALIEYDHKHNGGSSTEHNVMIPFNIIGRMYLTELEYRELMSKLLTQD